MNNLSEFQETGQPRFTVVRRKGPIFTTHDVLGIPLSQLFDLAMLEWPNASASEDEINEQLHELKKDAIALEYFHLLFHTACQYSICKKGRVTHSSSGDEFVLLNYCQIAKQLRIEPETLEALYQGKGTPDNVLNLLGWYHTQFSKVDFSQFYMSEVLIEHAFRIAREDREKLTMNRNTLLNRLLASSI